MGDEESMNDKPSTRFDQTTPDEKKRPGPRIIFMIFEIKTVGIPDIFPESTSMMYDNYHTISYEKPIKAYYFKENIPPKYQYNDSYKIKEIQLL